MKKFIERESKILFYEGLLSMVLGFFVLVENSGLPYVECVYASFILIFVFFSIARIAGKIIDLIARC